MSKFGFTAFMVVASLGLAACSDTEENVAVEDLNAAEDMNMSMDMNSDMNMDMDMDMNTTENAMDNMVEDATENDATTNSY
jgi:hypothetical protein